MSKDAVSSKGAANDAKFGMGFSSRHTRVHLGHLLSNPVTNFKGRKTRIARNAG